MKIFFLTASEVLQILENSDIENYRYAAYLADYVKQGNLKFWHLRMFMYVNVLQIDTTGPFSEFREPVIENYTPLSIGFMKSDEFQKLRSQLKYIYTRYAPNFRL